MMPFSVVLHAQSEKLNAADLVYVENNWPDITVTNTGIRTKVLIEGEGPLALPGDKVSLHFTATLLGGKELARFTDDAAPVMFRLDRYEAVRCFEEGLKLMRAGETRIFVVPYELSRGNGQIGHIKSLPRNATVVYEVKLIKIEHDTAGR